MNAENLGGMHADILATFEHLHTNPEVSWKEYQTTAFLASQLKQLDLRLTTFSDIPGVLGEWGPVKGPVVALRADMDALWQEVNGSWRANHSCGHDGHMAMVLGAAKLLRRVVPKPPVRIRILFQPAEEKGDGALQLAKRGAMDQVAYLFGVHVRPIDELADGKMSAAIRHGAVAELRGEICGRPAHAARPHLAINPIEVASSILQAAQSLHVDPLVPHSVTMTRLQAGGENSNIIPESAQFSLDLRAQTNSVMQRMIRETQQRIANIGTMYGASIHVEHRGSIVAAEVSSEARNLMAEAIVETLGPDALVSDIVSPGAEDFHHYTMLCPEVKATMLGLGCGVTPGLHHPDMTFNREQLIPGATILASVVMKACAQLS